MKKSIIAAALALALPMAANAAPFELTGKTFDLVGKLKLKANGTCYGMKFTGKGTADPLLLPVTATLAVIGDETGQGLEWTNDSLLPPGTIIDFVIESRSKNKMLTHPVTPADSLMLGKALLIKANAYPDFEQNAGLDSYTMTASFGKSGTTAKVKEVAQTSSADGPCIGTAIVTRQYTGVETLN